MKTTYRVVKPFLLAGSAVASLGVAAWAGWSWLTLTPMRKPRRERPVATRPVGRIAPIEPRR